MQITNLRATGLALIVKRRENRAAVSASAATTASLTTSDSATATSLLDLLINARDSEAASGASSQGGLSDEELLDNAMTFLLAGNDTPHFYVSHEHVFSVIV